MSAETDRLRREFEDAVKTGRTDHAQKVLAERDALILKERANAENIELFHGPDVEVVYQGATTYGQHLLWTPVVTSNGQVGLHIRSKEGGQSEFLYFNPSIDERNVFVYHGGELDPTEDPTECFLDVAEDWGQGQPDLVVNATEEGKEGKYKYLVVGIIDDAGNEDEPDTVREFFWADDPEGAYDAAIGVHNTIVIAGIFLDGKLIRSGWPEDKRVR